ncbi:MAG: hemerythrin family protein [bacterium]|nr:hemerythrin family protein [bacterium]
MAFIQWDDTYKLNIIIIDEQHQCLFELINQFSKAIKQKQPKQATADILKGLADYTVFHFHAEENLMELKNYPDYESQKAAHKFFVENVKEFQERVNRGGLLLPIEIANFLKEWLSNHILVMDRKLAIFLAQQGMK